jgi:hypothetical protein
MTMPLSLMEGPLSMGSRGQPPPLAQQVNAVEPSQRPFFEHPSFSLKEQTRLFNANHLIELAVAGAAATVVTQNVRDLRGGQLRFPQLSIETPVEFMKRWRKEYGDDDDSAS